MPATPKTPKTERSSQTRGQRGRPPKTPTSEKSQEDQSYESLHKKIQLLDTIDHEDAAVLSKELYDTLTRDKSNIKDYLNESVEKQNSSLEIYGWSRGKYIPNSFFDDLFEPNLNAKQVSLRGRGMWSTCCCPSKTDIERGQIDVAIPERQTNIERLYIMRPFRLRPCTLLDLIARSPKLKILRFYGVLDYGENEDHHSSFNTVRFLSSLERIYWPWCNRKKNLPVLKVIVKFNPTINALYSNGDTTCELLCSDLLPNLKHLSLILNEKWSCIDNNMRRQNRFLRKIPYLSAATNLESLEIRTFRLDLDEYEEDEEIGDQIRRLHENYQLLFWENVAKLRNLVYLAIYGAWELDGVARELARHGLQIEYLKFNLVPSSMIPAIDAGEDLLYLSMCDSIKELRKLTKLRSISMACHENLANIDDRTVMAFKEISDLIWVFDLRIAFSNEVEELISNILRRGNQQGKLFNVKVHVEAPKADYANIYFETLLKFVSSQSVKQQVTSIIDQEARDKFGRSSYKTFHLWGIEQAGHRDQDSYEKLKDRWSYYADIYRPMDMFA